MQKKTTMNESLKVRLSGLDGILHLLKKSSKTREASIKMVRNYVKILSGVIVASKCGPLAKIKKQALS